jgi:hypothetical protein
MTKIYRVFFILVFVVGMFVTGLPYSRPTERPKRLQFPRNYIPSGEQMYKDYCASCHGLDGKGHGPVSTYLTKQPSNLTTLAKPRGGAFPEEYVTTVLRFGLGLPAHGTSEMPVWGPFFQQIDNYNEAAVRQRIQKLCAFLESIQEK